MSFFFFSPPLFFASSLRLIIIIDDTFFFQLSAIAATALSLSHANLIHLAGVQASSIVLIVHHCNPSVAQSSSSATTADAFHQIPLSLLLSSIPLSSEAHPPTAAMKGISRLTVCAAVLLGLCIYVLNNVLHLCDQYNAGAYLVALMTHRERYPEHRKSTKAPKPGDKIIVMARLEEDNTDWVHEELSEYVSNTILSLSLFSSQLTPPFRAQKLATSNLRRQSIQYDRCQRAHHPGEQGP